MKYEYTISSRDIKREVERLKNAARVQIPPSAPEETILFVMNRVVFLLLLAGFRQKSFPAAIGLFPDTPKPAPIDILTIEKPLRML